MNAAIRLLAMMFMLLMTSSFVWADEVDAVLQWQRSVPLSTPISGVVIKVDGQVGERVKKGQVLFKLDDRARRAQVDALKAELKRAENNRDETEREFERTQELYDRTLISDHDLEIAKIQADDGVAQYQTAKASLVQAQIDLEYSSVRAPFSGWIAQRNVEVGQTVVSELQAEPLMVLVDATRMVARTKLTGSHISRLSIGQKAKVVVDNNTYSGQINFIGMKPAEGTTDQYTIDVVFEVGDKMFRAGRTVKVIF